MAAGMGKRFGGHKLRHPLQDGTPIGVQSALNLKQAVDEVVCVVRPDDDALIKLYSELGFTVVQNTEHLNGLSTSIRTGINARPDSDYWVIVLGDMPYIQSDTYQGLSSEIQHQLQIKPEFQKIIRPQFKGTAGHPVAFPNRFKSNLLCLEGDMGAAPLIKKTKDEIYWLLVEDKGVVLDIDTKDARSTGGSPANPLPKIIM